LPANFTDFHRLKGNFGAKIRVIRNAFWRNLWTFLVSVFGFRQKVLLISVASHSKGEPPSGELKIKNGEWKMRRNLQNSRVSFLIMFHFQYPFSIPRKGEPPSGPRNDGLPATKKKTKNRVKTLVIIPKICYTS
jgi:hypothetical protein